MHNSENTESQSQEPLPPELDKVERERQLDIGDALLDFSEAAINRALHMTDDADLEAKILSSRNQTVTGISVFEYEDRLLSHVKDENDVNYKCSIVKSRFEHDGSFQLNLTIPDNTPEHNLLAQLVCTYTKGEQLSEFHEKYLHDLKQASRFADWSTILLATNEFLTKVP